MSTTAATSDIRERMERMYRRQRLIYDVTRRYYLIGRDRLIAELDLAPSERLIDVGCGTGRNLAAIAARYPGAELHGLDAAAVMLDATAARFRRQGGPAPRLARAPAEDLDPPAHFGVAAADCLIFSYSLSMMDDPVAALYRAAAALAPDGRLLVVDFGAMEELPKPVAGAIRAWLARFGVRHRPEAAPTLRQIAQIEGGTVSRTRLAGGYAEILRLKVGRGRAVNAPGSGSRKPECAPSAGW